jgi:cold shock CspA family protein
VRGVVTRLVRNRGFAFLKGDDGIERFFHCSAVRPWINFSNLSEDDKVTFEEDRSAKGPRAKNIDLDSPNTVEVIGDHKTQAAETQQDKDDYADEVAARKVETGIGAKTYRRRSPAGLRTR